MMSNVHIKVFSRSEIQKDNALLKKIAKIVRQEELESDYPFSLPPLEFYEARYSLDPFPYDEIKYAIYEVDDKVIGFGLISSNSKLSSKMAFIFIYISPEYRGKRISIYILKEIMKFVPGRVEKIAFSLRADKFAPRYDQRRNLIEYISSIAGPIKFKARRSTSDLTLFSKEEIIKKAEELRNKAIEKGFSFEFIEDTPEFGNLLFNEQDYIKFMESIVNDMPKEDSSWEDIELDEKMFYYSFKNLKKLNKTKWTYIAIHKESKKPAGMTEVELILTILDIVYQGDTGVHQDFRGNRLGLTLKYMMLSRILTNELTKESKYWNTFNAHSNSHMLSINNELGYKENAMWVQFEIEKDQLIVYLSKKLK